MTKEEKREIIKESFKNFLKLQRPFIFLTDAALFTITLAMLLVFGNKQWLIFLIAMAVMFLVFHIICFIYTVNSKKQEMQRIKDEAHYIYSRFSENDNYIKPIKHKAYSEFFELLSTKYDVSYYAILKDTKTIKVFLKIKDSKEKIELGKIELEEIKLEEFSNFYEF